MKSFKKIFLMLTSFAMVVGTLLIGGGIKKTETVEAAVQTVTYTVATTESVTASGTPIPNSTVKYDQTYGTKCQMTKNNSTTLTINAPGYKLSSLVLSMKSNSSGGSGTLKINGNQKIDGTFKVWNGGSYSSKYVNIDVTSKSNDIKGLSLTNFEILISATANSLYIQSYTIGYEAETAKVSYNLNDGKLSNGATAIPDSAVELGSLIENPGSLTHSTDTNKIFMGWYYTDSNGVSKEWNFATDTVTSTLVLTAKWGYEVTINPDNDTALEEPKTVLEGTKISTLVPTEIPEKGGNKFVGWKKVIGTEITDIADTDLVASKLEIKAVWEEIKEPLVFVETANEIHEGTVKYYVDQEFALSAVVHNATALSYTWEIVEEDPTKPVLTNLSGSLNTKDIKFKANKIGDIYISISVSISESSEPISHELIVSITHPVKDIATSAWLGISYNEIKSETITYNIATMAAAANPKWQVGDNIGVSKDFPEGRNDLVFTATNGSTPTRYWGDDTWRFYKGATLKIESTDKKISSITIDGYKTVVNNNIFNKSFSDTTKIKEIIVELEGSITFTNIRARFGITIPKDTYQFDSIKSANVSFKVNIAGSEKIQTITMSDDKMTINDDGSITYVVSVVNIPLANCKDVIHVVPTITINGHSYDLAGTSYSVYGMVEDYLLQDAFADNVYLNALYSAIDEATTTTGA